MKKHLKTIAGGAFALVMCALSGEVRAQAQNVPPVPPLPVDAARSQTTPAAGQQPRNGSLPVTSAGVELPPGYVIGPEDVLGVLFWRDKDMTTEVAVRPDGMITLPLLNDVQAAGLTPEQLRDELTRAASKYLEEPNVTVVVKAMNSRKVFVTGMVGKVGAYPLTAPTTVLQLLAMAGGVHEFARTKEIVILRTENGKQVVHRFNYNDVKKGRNLKQNIELKSGDTVIVP